MGTPLKPFLSKNSHLVQSQALGVTHGTPPRPPAPSCTPPGALQVPPAPTYHGVQEPHVIQESGVHLQELLEVHLHQDRQVVPETSQLPFWSCRRALGEPQARDRAGSPGATLHKCMTCYDI